MKIPARILVFVLTPLFSFIFLYPALAASVGDVAINEIMWMGSSASTADEWLELCNTTDQDVDISGWQLTKRAGDSEVLMLEIPPEATISAQGYFLVSNNDRDYVFTNGESVLNVVPDLVDFAVSLTNTKLQIKLYDGVWDSGGNLIDTADDGVGAPAAGDNPTKSSMARKGSPGDGADPNSWYTSTASVGFDDGATEKGTPGSENTDGPEEDSPGEETTYPDQIFLNEIMPDPEGPDVEGEYMELYNAGDEDVDLEGWKVGDEKSTKIIGDDIKLSSYLVSGGGFLVIYRKDSHIILNNDGDTVKLWNPADEIVDEISYPEVDEGGVYQRYPDGDSSWSESNQPTAGAANEPSSNSSTSSGDPEITFSTEGSDFKVNQSFDVKVNIKNAKGLHDYYVKIRLGLEEGKLSKGRTYNSFSDTWLADNASWSKFPVVYTAADGTESLTFSAKVASGHPAGDYIIGVRTRDKETEKNYDSEAQTIIVGEEEEMSNEENNPNEEGEVLGATTELPATGANTVTFGYFSLTVGVLLRIFNYFGRVLSERRSLV